MADTYTPENIRRLLLWAEPNACAERADRIAELLNGGKGGKRLHEGAEPIPRRGPDGLGDLALLIVHAGADTEPGSEADVDVLLSVEEYLESALQELDRVQVLYEPNDPRPYVQDAISLVRGQRMWRGAAVGLGPGDPPTPPPSPKGGPPASREAYGVLYEALARLQQHYSDQTAGELTGLLLHALRKAESKEGAPLTPRAILSRKERTAKG